MKLKYFLFAIGAFFLGNLSAQIDVPSASPRSKLVQQVGYTTITIDYDRPSMRGAVIFGSLVPYGELWEMSINNPTLISFSEPVTIADLPLDAGVYAIQAVPGKEEWTIIFDRSSYYTHLMSVNPHNKEVLRVVAVPEFIDYHFETFTIDIGEITQSTASLIFVWENTILKLNIGTEADKIAVDKINAALEDPMAKMGNIYLVAAAYYLDNHKDIDQAMVWIDKAIEINRKEESYLFLKARIYAEMGDYRQAINFAKEAFTLAESQEHTAFKNRINISMNKWRELNQHK